MRHLKLSAAAAALAAFMSPAMISRATAAEIDIPYDQFTLKNGLRVVVHEDHKAPVVAVSVWYHVGSKDEPAGRTGFAHLFEHLMFNGSENFDGEWFQPIEEVGATDVNGSTWFDRTNYFETVPTPALDRVLWLESDRMGHLVEAITQAKLDEQRGVVQNEKRQGDNEPYGRMEYSQLAGLLPAGHPYSHSTIGSLDDLNAANLDTVKNWFRQYYGAANAVLVIAGDIDAKTAKEKVERYFGDIPSGPPLTRVKADAPKLALNKRDIMYDRVPQVRINRNWVAPGRTTKDSVLLGLAANVLGGGKTSRLYERLVHQRELATSASADLQDQELMSFYSVTVDPKKDADPAAVEAEMQAVIADFLAKGPTADELKRAKTSIKASVLRGLEKVGGFGGKAVTLAEGALYADDPGFFAKQLAWLDAATPADVLAAARGVMNAGYYQLTVLPYPDYATTASAVDRKKGLPAVPNSPDLTFPAVEETTLKNGLKVVFAQRTAVPIVNVALQFNAGYAADSVGGAKLGVASFAGAMLDEGTKKRDGLKIAEDLEGLGATLNIGSSLDATTVTLSTLKDNLQSSLDVMADVVRNATFDPAELEKQRSRRIAGIQQELASPSPLALRLLPPLMYGEGHAYGVPFTGTGTTASVKSMTRADLQKFHDDWLRPDNATLFVVGDATLAEIRPALERAFGDWAAPATPLPTKNIATVARPQKPRVIIVDRPDSPQTFILAGEVSPPTSAPNVVALDTMNDILGGQFTSRVNMNLREDKHWAYGAFTFFQNAVGQRPFLVFAPVQTDKTKESLSELMKELTTYKTTRQPTEAELDRTVANNVRSLPGSFETSGNVLGSLLNSNINHRPWDYPVTLKGKYQALSLGDINAAADEVIHPEGLIWVIVGDRAKIEAGVKSLGIAPVEVKSIGDL